MLMLQNITIYLRGEMGLDTDGQWQQLMRRKNYALLTDKGKVKLTGNTIKSKKLQTCRGIS